MRTIITSILVLVCYLGSAQELKELRHTRTTDYKMDFYITFSKKKVKYEDTLHYHWFKAQKIHVTQGSSEGNLLNGPFNKFYYSGQLAEQGQFENGLKEGEWKQWYESGNLMAIYNYDEGILSGSYTLYNENGDIRESGKIRKGEKKIDGEEKESWWQRRKKIKEAINPKKNKTKEEKKAERERKKEERKKKREERKIERERRLTEEGGFFQRLFRIKKKDKKKKKR